MKTRTQVLRKTAAILLCIAMVASSLILLPAAQDPIVNLYDKETAFAGFVNADNVEKPSTSHYMSDYLPVEYGDVLTFGPCNPDQDFYLHGYDSDGNIVDSTVGIARMTVEGDFGNYCILSYTVPSKVVSVRIANASAINDIFLVTKNRTFTVEEFRTFWNLDSDSELSSRFGKQFEQNTESELVGKSALFVGDSISCGSQESSLYYRAWAGRIGIVNQMDYVNASVSGASCSTTRSTKRIVTQLISNAGQTFDYVILHGGVNDAWDSCEVGTVSEGFSLVDFDIDTFAGGLEEMFYQANVLFPEAKLGYIINFRAPRCDKGDVANMDAYVAVAKQVCDKWEVPYLNLYEDDAFCNDVLKVESDENLPDYLHPNAGGYDLLYPVIEAWMEELPEYTFSLSAEDQVIRIGTEEELKKLADTPSGHFVLTNDITLTESWTPVPVFSGTLDGNGYAIRGLQITDAASTNWSNSGLVASLEGGTIRNLTLYGSLTNNVSGVSVQLGSFAGQVKNGTMENCISYVEITTDNTSGTVYAGGLVGVVSRNYTMTMTNCANYGAINIVCASGKYTNVGGVVAAVSGSADFVNVSNYGDVYAVATSNGYGQTGGVVGTTESVANNCVVTFVNCRNAGKVTSNGYTGGFIGVGKGTITVENCVNYGDIIDGSAYGAGFLAQAQGPLTMTGCVNLGDVTVTGRYLSGIVASATAGAVCQVRYCANLGNLTGTYEKTDGEFYGGIVGRNQVSGGVFANCISLGGMTANVANENYVGGIGGSEGKNAFENCFTTYQKVLGYGGGATSTEGSAVITAESDLEEIVGILNSGAETPMFRLNNGAIEPIYEMNREATKVIGTQETAVADGKFDIRFVATVNGLDYSAAGFRISAVIKSATGETQTVAEKVYTVNAVYDALTASENGEIELIEAPCGTYYMALVLRQVPADAEITFTVTSFVNEGDAAMNSQTVSVSFADGAIA